MKLRDRIDIILSKCFYEEAFGEDDTMIEVFHREEALDKLVSLFRRLKKEDVEP